SELDELPGSAKKSTTPGFLLGTRLRTGLGTQMASFDGKLQTQLNKISLVVFSSGEKQRRRRARRFRSSPHAHAALREGHRSLLGQRECHAQRTNRQCHGKVLHASPRGTDPLQNYLPGSRIPTVRA